MVTAVVAPTESHWPFLFFSEWMQVTCPPSKRTIPAHTDEASLP